MTSGMSKEPKIRFIPHLWVPILKAGQAYDKIELDRYRNRSVREPLGVVDWSAALDSRNKSIASIAQRSSVLMSALSLLIGAHLVLWINVYFRPVDPISPPMTMSTLTGQNVLVGMGLLIVALLILMTTLWFHWSSDLQDYGSPEAEYKRTRKLVKWRAFRVNSALLIMFLGLGVTISPYLIIVACSVCTGLWELFGALPMQRAASA